LSAAPDASERPWDAIVIGSGLGGLTCASLLARFGKRVLILERHTVPGGFTHTFSRKGFEWDVGVHYVGQVSNPNAIMRKVFDYISGGALKWAAMDPLYDRAVIAGDVYDFVAGVENQISELLKSFPDEEIAIRKYYKLVQSAGTSSAWFFGEKTMPPWLSRTAGFFLRRKFFRLASKTTYEVMRTLTNNEKLISVLCAQCGDYGMTPKRSSFGIHSVVVEHYLNGGSYPQGGAKKIHEAVLGVFRKHGGVLRLKSEVTLVLVEKGRAVGIELSSGQKFFAPIIISNVGARNTFNHLLESNASVPARYTSDLHRIRGSTAHACLYIGLNASDAELGLPKHNLWIYDQYDFDEAYDRSLKDPEGAPTLTYISFPSAKDPEWAEKHPGKATLQVITSCSYDSVREWEALPWMKRGEKYLKFKADLTEKLLQKAYEAVPQIRGKLAHVELSTPLSTRHFMNYESGEIYGLEHSPARFKLRWLRPRTPIRGLFLTGQDIITVGVGGALFSGILTAIAVLKAAIFVGFYREYAASKKQKTAETLP
jgi:all-trans-retinol 13,14-reductase